MAHGERYQAKEPRVPVREEKVALYQEVRSDLAALLDGELEVGVIMSSIVAVLHHTMPHYFWTGFYRVVDQELCVGPYQGSPACLRIARGRGVCGKAWVEAQSIVVEDVNAFPGHIACDARSASEIVIPWKHRDGTVAAVLDVDSEFPAAFDECDRENLMALAERYRFG